MEGVGFSRIDGVLLCSACSEVQRHLMALERYDARARALLASLEWTAHRVIACRGRVGPPVRAEIDEVVARLGVIFRGVGRGA